MNGHGKSDSPILPKKAPNKGDGAPTSAEEPEGRGLAKGNLLQQNKCRTQRREGADMANPKRARSGKPRRQPRGCTYAGPSDLQSALEQIRQAAANQARLRVMT
jgi:hypothetical protein